MWVPACMIYLGGITAVLVRWYGAGARGRAEPSATGSGSHVERRLNPEPGSTQVEWSRARHRRARLAPSYAPAGVALGVAMGLWGIVTHWVMSVAGAALFVIALWRWIAEIHADWRTDDA